MSAQEFIIQAIEEGLYFGTRAGNVVSNISGKTLTPLTDSGYKRVLIYIEGKRKLALVHYVVWLTYNQQVPSNLEINHKNGNKLDNSLSNLELLTPSENTKHALKLGLRKPICGSNHGAAKLTEAEVLQIRTLYQRNVCGYLKLSRMFNTSRENIRDIIKRKNWKHI